MFTSGKGKILQIEGGQNVKLNEIICSYSSLKEKGEKRK
jgi:hypothetical protein